MGHGKETPRQKMIGLMYLFLTCMLALNVSKDVLDSFVLVSEGLEKTVANYQAKNQKVYDEFAKQMTINERKVAPWKEKADKVKEMADDLSQTLNEDKIGLLKCAEGEETPSIVDGEIVPANMTSKDNIDKGGEYFILNKRGEAIKEKMEAYREYLLSIIPETEVALYDAVNSTLKTESHIDGEGVVHTWEQTVFDHIPVVADLVMLSKLQTDVKNVETDVINYLLSQVSADDFKFNALSATVIPNSSYVMRGGEYKATVFLAAFDSMQDPEILVGSYKKVGVDNYEMVGSYETLPVSKGKGVYTKAASSLGDKKWGGLIRIVRPDGSYSSYPFEESYQVAEPSLVISPTKMNVFYYGVENPVAISVPGIPSDKLKVSVQGATYKKVANGYEMKPTARSGNATVTVSAEIDGKVKNMGSMVFRIKTIPEPKAKIMGKSSGTIEKNVLLASPGLIAAMEDFVFDLKYKITDYNISTTVNGMTKSASVKGSKLSTEAINIIKSAKSGTKVYFEDIKAEGPDGKRELSTIVLKLK